MSIVTNGLQLYLDAGNQQSYRLPFSASWYDLSGNNNNLTYTYYAGYDTYYSNFQRGCYFYPFSNNLTSAASIVSNSTFPTGSAAAWIYPTTHTSSAVQSFAGFPVIEKASNGVGNGWCMSFMTGSTGIEFGMIMNASTNNGYKTINANNNIPLNTWSYLVCTWNGFGNNSNVNIYVNGFKKDTFARNTNPIGTWGSDSTANFQIGYDNASGCTISGYLANVQAYNRALSDIEVLQNYNDQKARFGL
jgi:hypothetical protein